MEKKTDCKTLTSIKNFLKFCLETNNCIEGATMTDCLLNVSMKTTKPLKIPSLFFFFFSCVPPKIHWNILFDLQSYTATLRPYYVASTFI